jgi:hypothetical protein
MRSGTRLLLAMACAATIVAFGASAAGANRLSSSSTGFQLIWTPTFANEVATVRCVQITLSGSFHSRVITKTFESLVGHITGATLREPERCTGGTVELLTEGLPWHFRYDTYTGTLPNITSIRFQIIGLKAGITEEGVTCLYQSNIAEPAGIILNREAGGGVSSVRSDERRTIFTITEEGLCQFFGELGISGSGAGVPNPIRFILV